MTSEQLAIIAACRNYRKTPSRTGYRAMMEALGENEAWLAHEHSRVRRQEAKNSWEDCLDLMFLERESRLARALELRRQLKDGFCGSGYEVRTSDAMTRIADAHDRRARGLEVWW